MGAIKHKNNAIYFFAAGDTAVSKLPILLHMEDASFTNSSPDSNSVSIAGTVVTSSAQVKYGTRSAYFNGAAGNKLNVSNYKNFQFGTKDFTVETWVYLENNIYYPGFGAEKYIMYTGEEFGGGVGINGTNCFLIWDSQYKYFAWRVNYSDVLISYISLPTGSAGGWYHLAVCRTGSQTTLYVNGSSDGSITSFTDTYNYNFNQFKLGSGYFSSVYGAFNGYIDEFRVVVDACIYTSSFTPPTATFSDSETYGTYEAYRDTQCLVTTSSVEFLNPKINSNLTYPTLTVTGSTILNSSYSYIIANSSSLTLSLPLASEYASVSTQPTIVNTTKEFIIFNRTNSNIMLTSSSTIDNSSSIFIPASGSARLNSYENKWWIF